MLIFTIVLYAIIIIALLVLLIVMLKKHVKTIDITKVKDEKNDKDNVVVVKK